MDESTYQRFQEICRGHGWKCTSQRLAVYACVHENYDHPDVDGVWRKVKDTLPSVTRESIYRILNEFTDHGLLHRLDHVASARYDCQVGPHGHFLCTRCGLIQDFPLPEPVAVPRDVISGDVEHLEVRLTGVCKRCRPPPPKPASNNLPTWRKKHHEDTFHHEAQHQEDDLHLRRQRRVDGVLVQTEIRSSKPPGKPGRLLFSAKSVSLGAMPFQAAF